MNTPMKKIFSVFFALILVFVQFSFVNNTSVESRIASSFSNISTSNLSVYQNLHLDDLGLSKEAFTNAMKGYNYLIASGKIKNEETISIVDFSLPSSQKRLFVIDLKHNKLLFNTYVSHGRNSGTDVATQFSNDPNSFESSLGFYITANTYTGKHGYSLRLDGIEPNINDNALKRGIVMHSAPYVNDQTIKKLGFLGRSEGCPAVPENVYKQIIAQIKDGSCLFMYSPNKDYLAHSQILNTPFA
jgi:hypothetical protein